MEPPSEETRQSLMDLRSHEAQYSGWGTNVSSFHYASIKSMLARLVEATESRLGSSIHAAEIVLPFDLILAPIPARWIDLLGHVSASLGLHVLPGGHGHRPAGHLALRAYGLGEPCPPGTDNGKYQLILVSNSSHSLGTRQSMSRESRAMALL